ncbi:MAG: isoprenylcysteine carboxylmethyltransferase family protein [Pseudomonadota bacterium]
MLTRPSSDVDEGTGVVGVLSFMICLYLLAALAVDPLSGLFILLLGTMLPMIVWSIVVVKTHLRPDAGLDFNRTLSNAEAWPISLTKLLGLYTIFAAIGLCYFVLEHYRARQYGLYLASMSMAAPLLVFLAPFYVHVVTRRMMEPRDGLWHVGMVLRGKRAEADIAKVKDHILAWTIKGFFLAFMMSILPFVTTDVLEELRAPGVLMSVGTTLLLVQVLFLIDACIGTIGYICTFRVLNTHIRSANPYLDAWIFALICYPPFIIMRDGGPLNYHTGTRDWSDWLSGHPVLLSIWGIMILILCAVYAWSTAVFGLRFSNLTHRGIITTGPYRFFKHPAYLSKNIFWWMSVMPFLSTMGPKRAIQNCILLLAVNVVYLMRARTEERHLMQDPAYQRYAQWIAEAGFLPRLWNFFWRSAKPTQHKD